ncbi:N-6 DNA methylase [Prolixibacteraceae bacterium Z1-6]|uniref:site-specific DNA-methyltransferase (adenine-specific) n=1 Tax=Draconibacterium aestuarii TaxID=2998507 RepID=A0A9X3F7U9_9BACT|nr:N-6 DNA methylase [Prolixibacteraceae bacterium Z1-6]
MAIKKSELYSSLWKSCDELRGSMDASQYKDYVLVLLFMKYVSDKGDKLVDIPEGASFKDMVKLKGQPDIGDKINKIIGALAKANDLAGIIDKADFNKDEHLGKGKEKVDTLSNLIEIFENEELDFSGNRATDDDILGDAYEFLMRHFATESGKSKGQFYTPSEVSRILAQVLGINKSQSQADTIYDPTCGSGSLLLKAADEAPHGISIYGQEKDEATRALSVMNMWLHSNPSADIRQGNTLSNPLFTDDTTGELKTFNYVVANPKFSDKTWMNGLDATNDIYKRFEGYENPPKKNGDYAYLLHIIKSLKSNGKGAVILPLGVLFRGNAEAEIRKNIVKRGYIKGIIGLPANLFYGTGIAACILVLDKENAAHRKGIFMIDAGKDFMKDGNKNRLRSQDIHKIVDVFNKQLEIPKYSRVVPISEISNLKNDYNLNIPRYIDSQEEEDIQDIEAHLLGGIPNRDIEALNNYWKVYPTLKTNLFKANSRANYWDLNVAKDEIKPSIFNHPEFLKYSDTMEKVFSKWKAKNTTYLKALEEACHPKEVIKEISEDILNTYHGKDLVDKYAVYQHLMDYWANIMQDDLYELSADGWKAGNIVTRIIKKSKKAGKEVEKQVAGIEGLEGRLIPTSLIIQEYFPTEQAAIDSLQTDLEATVAEMDELREENGGEDGLLTEAMDDKLKISKKNLDARIKELGRKDAENAEEWNMLAKYKKLMTKESKLKADIKKALAELEIKIIKQYPKLSIEEIKTIVVDKKWMATMENKIKTEMDAISHRLTERIKELAERYETPMPKLTNDVADLTAKVENHLKRMNYSW